MTGVFGAATMIRVHRHRGGDGRIMRSGDDLFHQRVRLISAPVPSRRPCSSISAPVQVKRRQPATPACLPLGRPANCAPDRDSAVAADFVADLLAGRCCAGGLLALAALVAASQEQRARQQSQQDRQSSTWDLHGWRDLQRESSLRSRACRARRSRTSRTRATTANNRPPREGHERRLNGAGLPGEGKSREGRRPPARATRAHPRGGV